MGTKAGNTGEDNGKVAPDNGTLCCKAESIKAVVTETREDREGDSRRGANTGPGQ